MATFYDLPAEIRNMIFEETFARQSPSPSNPQNNLALLRVSKPLHHEASSYFYGTRHLSITIPETGTNKPTPILPPLANRYLRFVRHLDVHVPATPSSHARNAASSLTALAGAKNVRLTSLRLAIVSPLSRLLNARVDDAILDHHHPLVASVHELLDTGTASELHIALQNASLAPGVAASLVAAFGARVTFSRTGVAVHEALGELERLPTGRVSTTHLAELGIEEADVAGFWSPSTAGVPTPLSCSIGSALSSLDAFSASSFGVGDEKCDSSDLFFDDDDDDDFDSSFGRDEGADQGVLGQMDGLDEEMEDCDFDCELEAISADEVEALLGNREEAAHWVANQGDVDYMVNFAPELLWRSHLGQGS